MPARDDEIGIAIGDRLRAEHRGFQARAADLVDRHGGHHVGQAGVDRSLTRRILTGASGEHLSHDDLGDLLGRNNFV